MARTNRDCSQESNERIFLQVASVEATSLKPHALFESIMYKRCGVLSSKKRRRVEGEVLIVSLYDSLWRLSGDEV